MSCVSVARDQNPLLSNPNHKMEPGMLPAPPEPIRNNPLAQALTHGSLDRALPLLFPYLSETVIAWFMPEERLWPVSIKGVVFVDAKVILLLNDRARNGSSQADALNWERRPKLVCAAS